MRLDDEEPVALLRWTGNRQRTTTAADRTTGETDTNCDTSRHHGRRPCYCRNSSAEPGGAHRSADDRSANCRACTALPSLARAPATAITRPPEVFVPLATCQRACSPWGPAYATAESALDDVASGSSVSMYWPTGTHILKLPSLFAMFCPTGFPVFLSTALIWIPEPPYL